MTNNSKIYVFSSIPKQGKTELITRLYDYFTAKGHRVACLQANKGQKDFKVYIKKNIYHYSIPLEASKSKAELEKWIPEGFDIYLMEITLDDSPTDIAYIPLFDNINEVISYSQLKTKKEDVLKYFEETWISKESQYKCKPSDFGDYFHNRNVQTVVTGADTDPGFPYMDNESGLHNQEAFVYDTISPKYKFPISDKRIITVGAFPDEFWDLYPQMRWYSSQYAKFMERFRKESYDIAVIGDSAQDKLKFYDRPKNHPIICYQPGIYVNLEKKERNLKVNTDFTTFIEDLHSIINGDEITDVDESLSWYNNKFKTFKPEPERKSIWKEGNIIFCNGWILPQYLINEGLLEVE